MTRRSLVVTLVFAVLLSAIPSSAATRRLGLLSLDAGGSSAEREVLMETLRELGFAVGRNLVVESRFAEGRRERLPELAAELVRLNVDVIVAERGQATRAAQAATSAVLRGAKPADIPVEEPTTFDLTVNARAARALGLTLPKSVLVRATRIVE